MCIYMYEFKVPLLWILENDPSCVTQLSEWKHPAKFSIWKCTMYKVIVSQKKESTLNHWNKSFLNESQAFHVDVNMKH